MTASGLAGPTAGSEWAAEALRLETRTASAISPRADFYRHVNQMWLDALVRPPYKAEVSMLSLLAEKIQTDVSTLVDSVVSTPHDRQTDAEQRISALYASFMNEDVIERLGTSVYQPAIRDIERAVDRDELSLVLGRLQSRGIGGAFEFSGSPGTDGSGACELLLSQSGIGLTAGEMTGPAGEDGLLAKYRVHMATMLGHMGVDAAADMADCVLRLEAELAAGHVSPGADGRHTARPLRCPASALAAREGGFSWLSWLAGLGLECGDAVVRVQQPGFLSAFESWWSGHELPELKNWLIWRFVHEMVPFGPHAVFTDNFRFYGRVVNGLSSPRPRRLRVMSFVETFCGEAIGERYTRSNLADGSVDAARELVGELVASYRERLERADWLRAPTRDAALRKIDNMIFEIGSPSQPSTAAGFQVDPADLFGNVLRARAAEVGRQLKRIGSQQDRLEWLTCSHQATAYYRHGLNHVVIPAAMLQPPLFDPAGDPAANFAVLGSIICHEVAHAFYGLGARHGEDGRPHAWWDPADLTEFSRRTDVLVEQYSSYSPEGLPGQRVNGARTLSENVADIVGLTVASHAYSRCLPATTAEPPALRRFFTCWASWWRSQCSAERMNGRLSWDRHAPAEFRCNGSLGHVAAFYAAFNVLPGDAMYIPQGQRFEFL